MKKNILALGCAVLMLALPGCVADTTTDLGANSTQLETRTVKVCVELPVAEDGTRIDLDKSNAFVWEEGDQVTAIGSNKALFSATLDKADVGRRLDEGATFKFTMPEGVSIWAIVRCNGAAYNRSYDKTGSAYAPFEIHLSDCSATNLRIGFQYNQSLAASSLSDIVDQLLYVGQYAGEEGNTILRNTMGIAEIKVQGTGKVWGCALHSRDYVLRSRYGYVNPTSNEPVWATYTSIQDSTNPSPMGMAYWCNITGDQVTLSKDKSVSFYVAVPVAHGTSYAKATHAAGDLMIQLRAQGAALGRTGDITVNYVSKNPHTFQRNHVTPFKAITLSLPNGVENAIDLSKDGLSNCYMIKPQKADTHYCFKANSLLNHQIVDGASATIAWATEDGLIKNLWYDRATGYIYFTLPAGTKNGSVIVAGTNPLTSTLPFVNNTWHIWITDAEDQTYGGLTVLDRNVGATYAPKSKEQVVAMDGYKAAETCGFYYQWGRRDPFPGPITIDGSKTTQWGLENGTAFIANTRAVKYKSLRWTCNFSNYTTADKKADAMRTYPLAMGHAVGKAAPTATAAGAYTWALDVTDPRGGSENTWAYEAKGNQDPCPQGYRIATYGELYKLFRNPGSETIRWGHYDVANETTYVASDVKGVKEYGGFAYANISGWNKTTNTDNPNASYKNTVLGNNFLWVPNAGYRQGNTKDVTKISKDGETGKIRFAGYATDATNNGKAVLWGVPPTLQKNADGNYVNIEGGAITLSVAFASHANAVTFNDEGGYWPVCPLLGMENCGNMYDLKKTLALNNAVPVRCVKIEKSDAALSVAPISGAANDANAWE